MNRNVLLAALIGIIALPAGWTQANGPMDWKRALALRDREVRGEALTQEEQDYLKKAKSSLDTKRDFAVATRMALAGMTGDGAGEVFQAPPAAVPLETSPVEIITAPASDGRRIDASLRKPPGPGPFPAVLMLHGGLDYQRPEKRSWFLTEGPVHTRLLQAGYAVVQGTFRTYNMRNLLEPGPLLDVIALFDKVRSLPFVDPESVAVFGGSGGGSLALDLAAQRRPAAIAVGEPATILFAGMLTTGEYEPRLKMMGDPHTYCKDENLRLMERKFKTFHSPILMFSGDIHPLKVMNLEIFLPAARQAGVKIETKLYSGEGHGFYFGSATSPAVVERVLSDATQHFGRYVRVKAKPMQP